jgi:hypothetical protein
VRQLALVALLLAPASASAAETRFPATGTPAVTFTVPDGWSGKETDGKFVAASADGSATVTIAIVPYSGDMEELAQLTLYAANMEQPTDPRSVSVADGHGYMFHSQQKGANGAAPREVLFVDAQIAPDRSLTGILSAADEEGVSR